MTTIEEAFQAVLATYGRTAHGDPKAAIRAAMLAAHVDGCAFEEFDSTGEWRECGQERWLCDIGKRIEELGR